MIERDKQVDKQQTKHNKKKEPAQQARKNAKEQPEQQHAGMATDHKGYVKRIEEKTEKH